jgi:hypothetical protein
MYFAWSKVKILEFRYKKMKGGRTVKLQLETFEGAL